MLLGRANAGKPAPDGKPAEGLTRDAALKARAYSDLVDFLYAQSRFGRFTPPIVFIMCFMLFQPYVPIWSLPLILLLQLGGTGLGEVLRRRHAQLSPDADRRNWAIGYAIVSGTCGLSWGMAGALWIIPDRPELQVVLVIILIAGVTGSLVTRSPHLPSLAAFVAATGAPFVLMQLYIGTTNSITIAVLALVYAFSIQGWARGLNNMYTREAMARLKAEGLVEDLQVARNIAEIRAEEAMEAREAAEAGARAKTEFLSTISHEVRTPLNGIQGMAELMQDTDLTADQQEWLKTIRESAGSLSVILDDIIDMSQHEAGMVDYDQDAYDPKDVASQIIKAVEPETRRKDLQVNLAVLPTVPATVNGDEKRCRQVLLNLVGNAVKFTDHGRITVRISVEKPETSGPEVLRYAVRDTGIGIAQGDIEKLFTEFAQIDQSATRRHGGRGLGLALVKRIVDQMGGDVGVRSTVGEGSEFWFDIPLVGEVNTDCQPGASSEGQGIRTSKVTDLIAALGHAKAAEIVTECIDSTWALTQSIEAARRQGDVPAIARAAHDLRSTAGNIGLEDVVAWANTISAAVRAADNATVLAQAERLPGEMANAQAGFIVAHPQFAEAVSRSGVTGPGDTAKVS